MKATVVAVTKDLNAVEDLGFLEENKTFSGKMAGICYQKDRYFDSPVSDPEKASKRFVVVANNTHHSIADHSCVTVVFEDISKMFAMILNSLNFYNTSEKSGRYTVMSASSDTEQKLYEKWKSIFYRRIKEVYSDFDDKTTEKLAQENARYMLSVFTRSTTMSYTTTLRQWNYIYDWCKDAINNKTADAEKDDFFYKELDKDLRFLSWFIKENLYVNELRDNKHRYFEFITGLNKDNPFNQNIENKLGLSYTISYNMSFVALAQAQRHRTIKYYMNVDKFEDHDCFYIPEIIRETYLEEDWIRDLLKIKNIYPQALLVGVVELGTLPNFLLKCEERLCGRAQLEIMRNTENTARLFVDNYNNLNIVEKYYVDKLHNEDNITTKCKLLEGCKEPCHWGSKDALTRLI